MMKFVKGSAALGLLGFLTVAADATDVIANARSLMTGTSVTRLTDARSWTQMLDEYGKCLEMKSPDSVASFTELDMNALLFRCWDGVAILHVTDATGRMVIRPIYSPMFEAPDEREAPSESVRAVSTSKVYAAGPDNASAVSNPALLRVADFSRVPDLLRVADLRPEAIDMVICQKTLGDGRFLIKVRRNDGVCVDQVLDTLRGQVVRETPGVSCVC